MKIIDVTIPPTFLDLGHDGENNWIEIVFDITAWQAKAPGGIVSIWLWPGGGRKIPVAVTIEGNLVTWLPQDRDLAYGAGKVQVIYQADEAVGMSAVMYYRVSASIPGGTDIEESPSWALKVAQDTMAQADRAIEGAETSELYAGRAQAAVTATPVTLYCVADGEQLLFYSADGERATWPMIDEYAGDKRAVFVSFPPMPEHDNLGASIGYVTNLAFDEEDETKVVTFDIVVPYVEILDEGTATSAKGMRLSMARPEDEDAA